MDGTLIEAAASLKSFKPRDGDRPKATDDDPGNPSVDFHGERRSNPTHQSTTDPEARLLRKGKGKEAKLVFMAMLDGNRHGMLVDFLTTQATGTAERDTVPVLVDQAKERGFHPKTLGGDKGYDTGIAWQPASARVTPHVAQNTNGRSSAIDGRTTCHPGYAISQRIRKLVEEIFGWMKTVGGFPKDAISGAGPDRSGGVPGSHGLQSGPYGQTPGAWQRKRQKPRWHDLTVGYPCPASPEDRVEKAAEAKSPAPTPQFPPRGPKDQRLEDPIPLPDPILQQPAKRLEGTLPDVRSPVAFESQVATNLTVHQGSKAPFARAGVIRIQAQLLFGNIYPSPHTFGDSTSDLGPPVFDHLPNLSGV